MALGFCDGCDSYDATADLLKKWARAGSPWTWSAAADQNGATNGILVAATSGGGALVPMSGVFGGDTRAGLGFWLKVSATPASTADIVRIINNSLTHVGSVRLTTSGFLQLTNSSNTQVFVGATNVCDNAWHWIDLAVQVGTNALQRCVVDVTSQWNGTGTMTAITDGLSHPELMSVASRTVSLSDPMFYSNTGTFTVATDFPLGARKITTRRPDGDDATQFTESTGTDSYALIDEVDGDTSDYVESGTSGHQDTYTYAALGFTPAAINAVMLNGYVSNPVPGTISFEQVAKSGATTVGGASVVAPSVTPFVAQQPFYVDPDTSAAWDEAGLDAAAFGIEVV